MLVAHEGDGKRRAVGQADLFPGQLRVVQGVLGQAGAGLLLDALMGKLVQLVAVGSQLQIAGFTLKAGHADLQQAAVILIGHTVNIDQIVLHGAQIDMLHHSFPPFISLRNSRLLSFLQS